MRAWQLEDSDDSCEGGRREVRALQETGHVEVACFAMGNHADVKEKLRRWYKREGLLCSISTSSDGIQDRVAVQWLGHI